MKFEDIRINSNKFLYHCEELNNEASHQALTENL